MDCCSFEQAIVAITSHAAAHDEPACVVTPNAQHIVLLESDAVFREAYAQAELVVPDGASLVLASRWLGTKLRERITGVDLLQRICRQATKLGLSVFLLGGRPGSALLAAQELRRRFPRLHIAGTCCPPYGFENDPRELHGIVETIRISRPDLVFVGLGAPKQERWMHEHGRHSGAPVLIGVGGSFEMVARVVSRAPRLLQRLGCEWLYRLLLEPRRLWKRYLLSNCKFLSIVVRQALARSCGWRWRDAAPDLASPELQEAPMMNE